MTRLSSKDSSGARRTKAWGHQPEPSGATKEDREPQSEAPDPLPDPSDFPLIGLLSFLRLPALFAVFCHILSLTLVPPRYIGICKSFSRVTAGGP